MSSHHDHAAHHHGPVVHGPPADESTAYRQAYDAARPDPCRTVVSVDLEAREVDWAIAPGATFRAWGAPGSATPTRTVDFGIKYSLRRGIDFVVNNEMHHHDDPVKVGELQIWDVVNSTLMDHPFHLHGFSFQVLAVNGKPPACLSREDVVNLPPKSTTRIAWMPDDRPGSWMYHCHILEHHAAGMMGHFDVVR